MANVYLRGKPCETYGELPLLGRQAPGFSLTSTKFKEKNLMSFADARKLIYTVSSLDSMVCAESTIKLNALAEGLDNTQVLVVSADLPFALQRFCKDNKPKKNVSILSMMRDKQFAMDYGVLLMDGQLAGLAARAVFVLDGNNTLLYSELVNDITDSPDFNLALKSL